MYVVDENVVVGATPATSGKVSIEDYGRKFAKSIDKIVFVITLCTILLKVRWIRFLKSF